MAAEAATGGTTRTRVDGRLARIPARVDMDGNRQDENKYVGS